MKLIFKRGLPTDADRMAAIECRCFSDPWSAESFCEMMSLPVAHCLTAWLQAEDGREENGSELVGYLLTLAVAPEVEIANVAVSPDYQKQGIGKRIMEEGMRQMREGGCDSFFLEVRESNLAAQALYRSLGFTETGRRKRYYQKPVEDALLMALLPEEAAE